MPYLEGRRVRDSMRVLSHIRLLLARERAADAGIVPALEHARAVRAVLCVVGGRVLRGAEGAGEDAHEDEAERGHAGADDADVDLDGGPVCCVGLVPGGVCGVGKGDEGLEADDGDDGYAWGC